MTRRIDKIKKNKEQARIQHNLSKSRLYKKKQEIAQEKETLQRISELPDVLIRIIYQYMSGNAKLLCNYKYDYLEKIMNNYPKITHLNFIRSLSKQELLNFLYKGILRKYPEIIESIDDEYYYDSETQDFITVNGYHLLNLWETNLLVYDFKSHSYVADHPHMDKAMKSKTINSIYDFLENIVSFYKRNQERLTVHKKWTVPGNALFLKIDRAFYLFKCLQHDKWNNQSKCLCQNVMNDTGGIYGVYTHN